MQSARNALRQSMTPVPNMDSASRCNPHERAEAKSLTYPDAMTGTDDAIRTKRISNMLQSPMPGGWVQPPGIVLLAQQAFPLPPFRMKK